MYCDLNDDKEVALRAPIFWLHGVKSPMYVFEGANHGNWPAIQMMVDENQNPNIQFFQVPGHDHFSEIAPVTELLAGQIVSGQVNVTTEMVQGLR
jgi:hypothetical protein